MGYFIPHAVCVPFPAQGHINPMLKLAKLLNYKGFHITFVNTEYNHNRLLKSRGPDSLNGTPTFRFETIPDGLPPFDANVMQDASSLCDSTKKTCLAPFRQLLSKLNNTSLSNVPPVTCIVSDCVMSFTLKAAQELNIPNVLFWTASACGFLAFVHYQMNVDVALGVEGSNSIGIGTVVPDHLGFVRVAFALHRIGSFTFDIEELFALREALVCAACRCGCFC
ncbi:hypothetical protein Dsin_002787 [Dipteronia sinensis]|uniref:Glycosyltransferase N-terminal domain-containing protein n=1 Tax=Dipteronia sinensis TaxID=43782 RepID=A0AAE0B6E6_9ROSI|nr:hypothetical protein Dsin_002787 [Dipteronia sinensis]